MYSASYEKYQQKRIERRKKNDHVKKIIRIVIGCVVLIKLLFPIGSQAVLSLLNSNDKYAMKDIFSPIQSDTKPMKVIPISNSDIAKALKEAGVKTPVAVASNTNGDSDTNVIGDAFYVTNNNDGNTTNTTNSISNLSDYDARSYSLASVNKMINNTAKGETETTIAANEVTKNDEKSKENEVEKVATMLATRTYVNIDKIARQEDHKKIENIKTVAVKEVPKNTVKGAGNTVEQVATMLATRTHVNIDRVENKLKDKHVYDINDIQGMID